MKISKEELKKIVELLPDVEKAGNEIIRALDVYYKLETRLILFKEKYLPFYKKEKEND